MTSPTMDAAVRYADLGIAVFPLRPRTKQPYGRTTGLKMAAADADLVRRRWGGLDVLPLKPAKPGEAENRKPVTAGPSANVAIATGAPAGFWVLDLDGPNAAVWLAEMERQHGPLPDTVEQLTARGRHLCFAWDAAWIGPDEIRNRSMLDGAPVDVRGQDGYIVAPPSVHPGDEKKGVPPGWVYRWRDGHAPWERGFAVAPQWLVDLVRPEPAPAVVISAPRQRMTGGASKYGEAALDRAVATIMGARVGSRDSTLYRNACSIARLVAGGEIELAYARSALEGAGRVHVPSAMTEAQLVRQVERALVWGSTREKIAPRRDAPERAWTGRDRTSPQSALRPAELALEALDDDPAGLWAEGRAADVGMVRTWLKLRRLPHEGVFANMAMTMLRAHPAAPVNRRGERLPCLMLGLSRAGFMGLMSGDPEAVAMLPLAGGPDGRGAERFVHIVGDARGCAGWLAPADSDDGAGQLLVCTDFQDAWSLGADASDSDDAMGVAVTPMLSAFCGGALGDAWGRVNPDMPHADAATPPWTAPGMAAVYLAVRGDLRPPELKVRKFEGGTRRVALSGDAAARFCGALAEQSWRRTRAEGGPEANAVRLLRPSHGVGFHEAGMS